MMKQVVRCGRCNASIDIPIGMKIGICMTPMGKQTHFHTVEVDRKTDEGFQYVKHIERKPEPRYR